MWWKRAKLRRSRWRATASAGSAAASAARKMERAWRRRVLVVIAGTLEFEGCDSTQRRKDVEISAELMTRRRRGGMGWETQRHFDATARKKNAPRKGGMEA